MITLPVIFLKEEMQEIRDVVSVMGDIVILAEQEIPDSDLVKVGFMLSDPSVLYTMGLLVGIKRAKAASDKIFKNPHL